MYNAKDHIQESDEGFGHRGYKYRVMGKDNNYPTHHTNSYDDALAWSEKCIRYWIEQDSLAAEDIS